jgi:hypothetical protein
VLRSNFLALHRRHEGDSDSKRRSNKAYRRQDHTCTHTTQRKIFRGDTSCDGYRIASRVSIDVTLLPRMTCSYGQL